MTDQLALFKSWIDAAIEGAVTTSLQPGEKADATALIFALVDRAGSEVARNPSRDQRGVLLAQIRRRLNEASKRGG